LSFHFLSRRVGRSIRAQQGRGHTAEKIILIISHIGQSMSYPLFHDGAMKRYKTHYPRRNLLSVPYSVRPDRIERGLRILRALRFSIAAAAAPFPRQHQGEFEFILSKRA
jgi:hypothetical protein